MDGISTNTEEHHEWIRRTTPRSVLRRHLRGPRPGDRQRDPPLAPRRHRPLRSREAHGQARRRSAEEGGSRSRADLRRLPDQPVAPCQEAAPRDEHLPGLRTQRHQPHPARPRPHRDPPARLQADRSALRRPAAPRHRPGTRTEEPSTRSTSSSAARSPTPTGEASSPATSPSSQGHRSNAPARRPKAPPGPKTSSASFCALQLGTGSSRSSGSPP